MIKKIAMLVLIAVCAMITLGALPVMAQGVSRQEYSGLDKYLTQGRLSNSTFVGVRAAEVSDNSRGRQGYWTG